MDEAVAEYLRRTMRTEPSAQEVADLTTLCEMLSRDLGRAVGPAEASRRAINRYIGRADPDA